MLWHDAWSLHALVTLHGFTGSQFLPSPVWNSGHWHDTFKGPIKRHLARGEQPPLMTVVLSHKLIASQVSPEPKYPLLHVHLAIPGPVLLHVA